MNNLSEALKQLRTSEDCDRARVILNHQMADELLSPEELTQKLALENATLRRLLRENGQIVVEGAVA